MLAAILVEATGSHVEILDLQMLDPILLSFIMIAQLDKLIVNIINGYLLIIMVTLIIEFTVLGVTFKHLFFHGLRNHCIQLLTVTAQYSLN